MTKLCKQVELFADGELGFEEAEAFRQHLPECARCQRGMANLIQLKLLGQRYRERAAGQDSALVETGP